MEIKEQDNIPYSEKRIGNETQFAVDLRRDILDLIVLMVDGNLFESRPTL